MRAGILTFPNSISYGATLQMYALQKTIEKLGYPVEVINYHNTYMKAEQHHQNTAGKVETVYLLRKKLRQLMHWRMYTSFRKFENKNIHLYPKRAVSDKDKLKEIGRRYNAVVCGSDQVWNPDITDTDLSYFLDFCGAETKRISYAPSFGIESFPEEFCNTVVKELEQFSAISVREENGQKMIRQYLEREVPLVLDPTMLIGRTEWSELEKPYPIENEQYILYYTIRKSDELFRFCREFAEKKGMKVVVVGGNMLKKLRNSDKNIIYANDISPEQWLYLMHHAGFVITNSFHGTAFSINYHKEFYVELSSYTNSRLRQIMKTTGLEERIFKTDISQESECIDYEEVDNKLSVLCRNSMKFLENALREDFANG